MSLTLTTAAATAASVGGVAFVLVELLFMRRTSVPGVLAFDLFQGCGAEGRFLWARKISRPEVCWRQHEIFQSSASCCRLIT